MVKSRLSMGATALAVLSLSAALLVTSSPPAFAAGKKTGDKNIVASGSTGGKKKSTSDSGNDLRIDQGYTIKKFKVIDNIDSSSSLSDDIYTKGGRERALKRLKLEKDIRKCLNDLPKWDGVVQTCDKESILISVIEMDKQQLARNKTEMGKILNYLKDEKYKDEIYKETIASAKKEEARVKKNIDYLERDIKKIKTILDKLRRVCKKCKKLEEALQNVGKQVLSGTRARDKKSDKGSGKKETEGSIEVIQNGNAGLSAVLAPDDNLPLPADAFGGKKKKKEKKPVTGGGSKTAGKLPDYHTIAITVTRDKKKPATGKKPEEVALPGGGSKDITVGGGSENKQKSERSVKHLPGYKQAGGCDYLKPPGTLGAGSIGLNGLPKSFPLPPLTNKTVPWRFTSPGGYIYDIGVMTSLKDTADFIRKELPIRGWKIDKNAKPSPQARADAVHIFFNNADYCGWVTISAISGKGAPAATGMFVGIKKRAKGMR